MGWILLDRHALIFLTTNSPRMFLLVYDHVATISPGSGLGTGSIGKRREGNEVDSSWRSRAIAHARATR